MSSTIVEIIARNIAIERRKKGLSQKDVAERMGVMQSHLSRLESTKHTVSLEVLERIAKALEVPIQDFFVSDRVEDLSLLEKLRKIQSLPQDKQTTILHMLDTFLREEQFLSQDKSRMNLLKKNTKQWEQENGRGE